MTTNELASLRYEHQVEQTYLKQKRQCIADLKKTLANELVEEAHSATKLESLREKIVRLERTIV